MRAMRFGVDQNSRSSSVRRDGQHRTKSRSASDLSALLGFTASAFWSSEGRSRRKPTTGAYRSPAEPARAADIAEPTRQRLSRRALLPRCDRSPIMPRRKRLVRIAARPPEDGGSARISAIACSGDGAALTPRA